MIVNKTAAMGTSEYIGNDSVRLLVLMEVVAFLNRRAGELHNLGGVHVREAVALGEAAIMIENGMWKE